MIDSERNLILDKACRALAAALPDAWAVYVYGSFARGDEWPDSDLDLAVLLPPRAELQDKLTLIAEVSQQVGREVDIVSLRSASLDLVHELLREGRPLLVRRAGDVLGWEAERMTDYADFSPRRADILAQYLHEPLRRSS
ncbi:MAG: nucleotidyltransferase domain-containing protein [Gammaproteobacteria bacterium]